MAKKITVAHYNDGFFHKSETFIYNYVSNLKAFTPIFFAREFVNPELFTFCKEDGYTVPVELPHRFTWRWLCSGLLRRFFGTHTCGEEIVLRERNARLIHAHFAPQGFFALNWRGKLRIPIVTNFYGYDVSELPNDPEWAKRLKILFNEGSLFLVEGNFMRSKLVEIGCPEEKIQIQRIAISLDKLPFKTRLPKGNGEKTIFLFCGRFVEKKGLLFVLEAFNRVREKYKDFEFRIIGDGPLKSQIEKLIDTLNLSGNVKLLGFLNYNEYINEMKKADIFIHPSVTALSGDSEGGAPTVILEAQAMGLPVIASTHADIPNIVVPGKSALLSAERDIPGLVEHILFLLSNQNLWAKMGQTGRRFVEEYHDIQKEIGFLEEKYRSLIQEQ